MFESLSQEKAEALLRMVSQPVAEPRALLRKKVLRIIECAIQGWTAGEGPGATFPAGPGKIAAIKLIRVETFLNLAEAKALAEIIKNVLPKECGQAAEDMYASADVQAWLKTRQRIFAQELVEEYLCEMLARSERGAL